MKRIDPFELSLSIFNEIGKKGFLLLSGEEQNHNSMTVGWASLGYLWKKPMAFVYVRPQRYTYEFMEKYNYFSINFFSQDFNDILQLFGTKSGREIDKMHPPKITPLNFENKTCYYKEADMVLICRKVYIEDLKPENFVDKTFLKNYPLHDFHRIYYGEIDTIFEP